MQMTRSEIHYRFNNMVGKAEDRIEKLAQLNACSKGYIRQILQEVESGRTSEPEVEAYHPDENPHCKVEVEINTAEKGDIPEHVLNLIFDRLDELDREIKERQTEYNELVAYIGGSK